MAAKKRKCATPKCRGNVRADNKFCLACHRKTFRLMQESGYLEDINWIRNAERRRRELEEANKPARQKSPRHAIPKTSARQLSGNLMVSKKGKK